MFLDIRYLVIIFLAWSVNGTTSQNPVLSFTVQSADNNYTVNISDKQLSPCFCTCETSVCTPSNEGPYLAVTCGEQDGNDQANSGSTCFMCKTSGVDMVSCTRHSSCDEFPQCILTSESCNRKISITWDKGIAVECVSADVSGQNSSWACQCYTMASTDSPPLASETTMTPSNSTAAVGPSGDSWTSSTTIGVAVGVSVGVTMIIVSLIGLILWRKRQRSLMERPVVPLPKSYLLNVEKQTPQKQFTSGGLNNVIAVEPTCVNAGYDDRGDGGDGLIYEIVTDPASHKASGQDQRWTTLYNNKNNNNVNTPSSNINSSSNNTRVKNIKKTRETNIKSTPKTNIGDRLDTGVALNKQQANGSLSDTTTDRVSVGPDSDRVYEEISPTDNDGISLGRSPAPTAATTTAKTHSGGDITTGPSLYKNVPTGEIQSDIPEMPDVENRQDSVYFELEKEEVLDDDYDVDVDVEEDKKAPDEDSEDDNDHLYSNV